jgi:hypothetical protein
LSAVKIPHSTFWPLFLLGALLVHLGRSMKIDGLGYTGAVIVAGLFLLFTPGKGTSKK